MQKLLFAFLVLCMGSVTLASESPVQIKCSVGKNQSPYDVYTITFLNPAEASVSYVSSAFFGSEEVPRQGVVPGCAPAQSAELTKKKVYVECDGDGDAGYISLKTLKNGKLTGTVNFPEGNLDYDMNTKLKVTCYFVK